MLDFNLDLPQKEFDKLLKDTISLISHYQKNIESKNAFKFQSPQQMQELFNEPLPKKGESLDKIMKDVQHNVFENATYNIGPNFYAYVLSCGNHVGMVGDFLSTFLNQNVGKWHLSAPGVEIEKLVIKWIKAFIGLPDAPGGILVSGGSMANLTALAVARNVKVPEIGTKGLFARKPLRVYSSKEVHSCVDKACDLLGLGKENLQKIAIDKNYCLDVIALENAIKEDISNGYQPFCVVANAGTVNIGAIDPLAEIAAICRKYDLWLHVDAAYGGPAAATDLVGKEFSGLDLADSIALDPHKWLYIPIEAGCVLVKNEEHLRSTYSYIPDYLKADQGGDGRLDYMEYGVQLSRGFRALKIWMTFKAFGALKMRQAIANDILKARYLAQKIDSMPDFELLAPVPLSVVCFRYKPRSYGEEEINKFNQRLLQRLEKDGRVFITGTKVMGKVALRACIVNHRTQQQHLDYLLDVIHELASKEMPCVCK